MTQHRNSDRFSRADQLAALSSPACEVCRTQTRFVGLESSPDGDQSDLCTYECSQCGHVQATLVARAQVLDEQPHGLFQ